jgi:fucose 4-O-acetylase-like acetyltransferase
MPLFFMISGALCIEGMRKSPVNAFISRTESIAWPYILWNVVIGIALLPLVTALSDRAPVNVDWNATFYLALTGELSWFLWTLYVMQVLLIPLARVPAWLLCVVSVVLCLASQNIHLGPFNAVVDHSPFLLFGAMLQPFLGQLKVACRWKSLLLSLAAFGLMGVALQYGWTAHKPVWILCGIGGSLASILIVQCIGRLLEDKVLASLGIASLAIFVLHPYFQGTARMLVFHVAGATPLWQILLPTIFGVLGPFAVWKLAQQYGMSWLFRLDLPRLSEQKFKRAFADRK